MISTQQAQHTSSAVDDFTLRPLAAEDDVPFAREGLLDGWDAGRIARARVAVIGAGALGNEVLKNLALLGFRQIFIMDMDTVARSNLSRAVLFRQGDGGQSKAAVAARRTRRLCVARPASVRAIEGDIALDLGAGVLRRMDVVIGCVDNVAARLAIDAACWLWDVPWVEGGIAGYGGSVTVFVPPGGPCYRCTLSSADRRAERERYSCEGRRARAGAGGHVPAIQTSSAVIAATQVQETLKLLAGERQPRTILYDGQHNTMQQARMGSLSDHAGHHPSLCARPIHKLRSLRHTTGLPDALAQLAAALGSSDITIRLDHPFVRAAICGRCGHAEPVDRPLPRIWADEYTACAACGGTGDGEGGALRLDQHREVSAADLLLLGGLTLGELGIPPLHVLQVRAGGTTHYVELTGDLPQVLGRWGVQRGARGGIDGE